MSKHEKLYGVCKNKCLVELTPEIIGAASERYVDDQMAQALPTSGGAMTGAITLKGIYLTEGVDYGTSLPSSAPKGKLFGVKVE